MVHLRLIVPTELATAIVGELRAAPGVAHVVHVQTSSTSPPGEVVLCDVAREAANGVIESLQRRDIHRRGAITVENLEAVISDAAASADALAPGHGSEALIWEELEARARVDGTLTASYLVFMGVAAVIAGVGILLDSPILIVGAMVVGPEYAPLSAICVASVRRRVRPASIAGNTLAMGLLAAAATSLAATLGFRASGLAPDVYGISDRQLTAFIAEPSVLSAVVAVAAGIVGMLSLTQVRSGSLIGVLVSVTTIPAVANIGVATAYAQWSEVGGAMLQLVINIVSLLIAGVVTLAVQQRVTA